MAFHHFLRILLALIISTVLLIHPKTAIAETPGSVIRVAEDGAVSGSCGESWSAPCNLQYALTSLAVPGDEIWVRAGTYTPTNDLNYHISFEVKTGISLYGGFAGTETLREQRSWLKKQTVLSGDLEKNDTVDPTTHIRHSVGMNSAVVVNVFDADGATLDGFTILGGFSDGMFDHNGSGVYVNISSATLRNLIIKENNTSYMGGAIFIYNSTVKLENVAMVYNQGGLGTAIKNQYGRVTLTNVTMLGNQGGGAVVDNEGPQMTLNHVTITDNFSYGEVISNDNTETPIQVHNSIIWGNRPPEVWNSYSGLIDLTYSYAAAWKFGGDHVFTNDPLIGSLDWDNRATMSIPLLPGSGALDTADPAYCPETDQRGVARPQGNGCDMGALESEGFLLEATGGDQQSTMINNTFPSPLSARVFFANGQTVNSGLLTFIVPTDGASALLSKNPVPIVNGTASANLQANGQPGAYEVTASAAGANMTTFHLTNKKELVQVRITGHTPDSSYVNQPVNVTFEVSVLPPGRNVPTGMVTVSDGVSSSCSALVSVGSCQLSISTYGGRWLRATYQGDDLHERNVSNSVLHQVLRYETTVTLSSISNPSLPYHGATFQISVNSLTGNGRIPTGMVLIRKTGEYSSGYVTLIDGTATFTTANLDVGSHSFEASYLGDEYFEGSDSTAISQLVQYPAPQLSSLGLNTINANFGGFFLTVYGSQFYPNSIVRWNGQDLEAQFLNENSLMAFVPGELISAPGTAMITVYTPGTGGGETKALPFYVLDNAAIYLPFVVR